MEMLFFATPQDFRCWLLEHHGEADELWAGYYKKHTGKPSLTWPQSVDEALCFGWIDGIRKSVDGESYAIRFTPRRKNSIWSEVNIRRAKELIDMGLMQPAGLVAFEKRKENISGDYSYEQRKAALPPLYEERFRQNFVAWDFYQTQSLSYRKMVTWWVVSAKKEETKIKRLEQLIECSAGKRKIPALDSSNYGKRNNSNS